jgi:hypothetical protein
MVSVSCVSGATVFPEEEVDEDDNGEAGEGTCCIVCMASSSKLLIEADKDTSSAELIVVEAVELLFDPASSSIGTMSVSLVMRSYLVTNRVKRLHRLVSFCLNLNQIFKKIVFC